MKIQTITPKKAVNKAYLKERINRPDIDKFKQNFVSLFDRLKVSEKESEEFYKNIVSDFLKNTFYTPQYEINTKGREDLVIHTGKTTKENVGVIFETKKPNSTEMLTDAKPNVKALHQLILYYLQERIDHKNIDVKHLIVTDIYNWYIFDENLFDKHFFKNAKFIKGYETFKQSGKNTDFFYKEVAKPILDGLDIELECTHFDLKNFEKTVTNADLEDDKQLIALYKILSPVHLLKLPFANDSNQLDKNFYTELLHIIGLEEIKDGSKKLIKRKTKPDEFSLLENTITKIENRGFSNVTDLHKLGTTKAEQAFNIALELSITWVNRVLFLKLLEAQLITYHKGDPSFRFLNAANIYDYDRLNKLFFEVLAEKTENRKGKVKTEFSKIPYLNSSLFERTDLERKTVEVNYLDGGEEIPILTNTVLKDDKGKRKTGNLPTLQYLFAFLDSYDFASEGTEGIQDDKRTLINASVLGLIFEKINGYKDGSFFTPGFITMYMCRETIRRAIVQKFKEHGYKAETFDDLKDEISDRKKANDIINSLKICDPAVGSGHFLVSALNEIIAIKSDLDVLSYRDGSRVKYYKVEIQNDELIVTDEENGDIFQYLVNEKGIPPKELQKLQETLFHEKQTIIENCLFGVDINPNSVKICRLRLWIELLKNAYYTEGSQFLQLETLPNIDINIKQGNSLISRFKLNDDLSEVFKKHKFSYKAYRKAVEDYKNTNSKEAKAELLTFITDIKEQFQTSFHSRLKENKELAKFRGQLYNLQNQGDLFGGKVDKIEVDRLEKLVAQFEQKVKEIKDNVIFSDAFEWRFEFPEVLNTEGGYVGFDILIGNPPYINIVNIDNEPIRLFYQSYKTFKNKSDLYSFFTEKGVQLLKTGGELGFIVSNSWLATESFFNFRKFLLDETKISELVDLPLGTFAEASVTPLIYMLKKEKVEYAEIKLLKAIENQFDVLPNILTYNQIKELPQLTFGFNPKNAFKIETLKLSNIVSFSLGIKTSDDKRFIFDEKTENKDCFKILRGKDIDRYTTKYANKWILYKPDLINEKAGGRPRILSNFLKPKILIKDIANIIQATYDSENYLVLDTLNVIHESKKEYNLKFILALLNSKLVNHWFKSNFEAGLHIKINQLGEIPIIKFGNQTEQEPIVKLVEKILESKKSTPSVSTVDLEKEIDKLVYGLYGLTEEEIEIIENSIK